MSFGSCRDHEREPPLKSERCETCARIKAESRMAARVVSDLLKAGFEVSVYDGVEVTVKRSTDTKAIMDALFTTDEDHLFAYVKGEPKRFGWVFLVYGNSGAELVNDYTTNLEEALSGAMAFAETLQA